MTNAATVRSRAGNSMQLDCPHCGLREVEEFHCRGTVPEFDGDSLEGIYLRIDRPDVSREYWQHVDGCRSWLLVCRNPSTNAVLSIEILAAATSVPGK